MDESKLDENRIGRKALDQNRLDENWAHVFNRYILFVNNLLDSAALNVYTTVGKNTSMKPLTTEASDGLTD